MRNAIMALMSIELMLNAVSLNATAADPGVLDLAWLIVLLPLGSSFVIALLGERMPAHGAELGIIATATSSVLASAARSASRPGSRRTFGCPMRWPARRPSRP